MNWFGEWRRLRDRAEQKFANQISSDVRAAGWPVVIVESPFAGDMEANRAYALKACADCLRRREVPYASHLFFPQLLDELKPEERELGLTAGYAIWRCASKIVVYADRGWSNGMNRALARAERLGFTIEVRSLEA